METRRTNADDPQPEYASQAQGGSPMLLPAVIEGRFARLRPIVSMDYPLLFAWRSDGRWPPPFSGRSDRFVGSGLSPARRITGFDEWQQTELQFLLQAGIALLVEGTDRGAPLGIAWANTFSDIDSWAHYREFFPGDLYETVQAAEATILFVDHLFERYALRKLYSEMMACDEGPIEKLKRAGFREEVRLKEDVWYGASFVDYVYLGLFREEWQERRASYLMELATQRAGSGSLPADRDGQPWQGVPDV